MNFTTISRKVVIKFFFYYYKINDTRSLWLLCNLLFHRGGLIIPKINLESILFLGLLTYINYSANLLDHLELKQYIKLFLIRILEITSLIDIELLFYSIQAQ